MRTYKKAGFPTERIRRFLEPGPVVLVSSAHGGDRDVMTRGWHMVLEDGPSLVGCFIWDQNHSRGLIGKSRECVINLPTSDLIDAVIGVGNTHGPDVDKFAEFRADPGEGGEGRGAAHRGVRCELRVPTGRRQPGGQVQPVRHRVRQGHVATSPKYPRTVHYRGDGVFMIAGEDRSYRRKFKPGML